MKTKATWLSAAIVVMAFEFRNFRWSTSSVCEVARSLRRARRNGMARSDERAVDEMRAVGR